MDRTSKNNADMDLGNTIKYRKTNEKKSAHQVLMTACEAMMEKGYDPVNQIVGYLLSGDPTYVTSYNNARYLIRTIERDELVEELVRTYLEQYGKENNL